VLDEVGKAMGLNSHSKDYYKVDGILYGTNDLVPKIKDNECWLKSITVAFEHEHIYDMDLFKETAHLLILRSKLSVLVTYPPRGDGANNILQYLRSIIDVCPHAKELDAAENFLLILGYPDPLEWDGLVYSKTEVSGWKKI
jgi:hypothetical protein